MTGDDIYYILDVFSEIFNISPNIISKSQFTTQKMREIFQILSLEIEKHSSKDELGRIEPVWDVKKYLTPIVNKEFSKLIKQYEIDLNILKKAPFWKNNAPYAVCLTHDVDNITKWHIKRTLSYILHGKVKDILQSIGKKEYWNFQKIMDLEKKFGYKSTFFFLSNQKGKYCDYNLWQVKKAIKQLVEEGFEIGLHTGFFSYNNIEKISYEKRKLEETSGRHIVGVRNHYLRFDIPLSWELLEKAGFEYDTTLGFRVPGFIGFRSGIAHPYHPYNLSSHKIFRIYELPMSIMDYCIMNQHNKRELFEQLLKNVKKYRGMLVLNWHPSHFDEKDFPGYGHFYEEMLKVFNKDNAFVSTCEEVLEWWKKRQEMYS